MKNILFVLSAFMCTLSLFCSCQKKNYSVDVNDGYVIVKMRSPSIGVAGLWEVHFDGFTYEDVEEEIFDKIRSSSYEGFYTVYVILQYIDSYGNYYDGPKTTVSTLQASEVKRYASYSYFRGQTHLEYSYLGKPKRPCEHCTNGVVQIPKEVIKEVKCPECGGEGYVKDPEDIYDETDIYVPCTSCHGEGKTYEKTTEYDNVTCTFCRGTGEVE